MPEFVVTSPDGRKFKVTAPDGATPQETFGHVAKQALPKSMQHRNDMGVGERFLFGFEEPFIGTQQSFQHTAGQPDAVDKAVRQREQERIARTGGGFDPVMTAGSMANPINLMGAGGAVTAPGRVLGGAVAGALGGMTQPVVTDDGEGFNIRKAEQGVMGGAAGAALSATGSAARALPRVVTPYPRSAQRQGLLNELDQAGIRYTAGQASGNKGLLYNEAHLGELPLSGGATERVNERSATDFNRWALSQAGTQGDRADQATVNGMWQDLSDRYDQLTARNHLLFGVQEWNRLQAALHDYQMLVPPGERAPGVERAINELGDMAVNNRGVVDGRTYQATRSRFERYARAARADPERAEALREIARTLDDAMEQTLASRQSPDLGEFRTLRTHYRNAIAIQDAIGSGADANNILPNKLRNALLQQNKKAYRRGQRDMAPVTDAADQVLAKLPQSGTAPRAATTAPVRSIVGGLGGRALHSDPAQGYLRNQIMPGNLGIVPDIFPALAPGAGSALAQPNDGLSQ